LPVRHAVLASSTCRPCQFDMPSLPVRHAVLASSTTAVASDPTLVDSLGSLPIIDDSLLAENLDAILGVFIFAEVIRMRSRRRARGERCRDRILTTVRPRPPDPTGQEQQDSAAPRRMQHLAAILTSVGIFPIAVVCALFGFPLVRVSKFCPPNHAMDFPTIHSTPSTPVSRPRSHSPLDSSLVLTSKPQPSQ
jgi:hypothetical protein